MRLHKCIYKQEISKYPNNGFGREKLGISPGFTLIEVMVTLIIIGIVAGIAVGGYRSYIPDFRLNSAAQQLQGDMQRCKMAAVRNNTACLMSFNSGSDAANPGNYTACLSEDSSCAGDQTVLSGDLSSDAYSGVWLDNVNFSGATAISFDKKGMPDSSGSVIFRAGQGESRAVNASITGGIQIQG